MKQLLIAIAVIFCMVGCGDRPKSDNPQGYMLDSAEFKYPNSKWPINDSLKLYGHVYDDDALNYIIACGADSILGKYNWRRLDNGDIEYFDKKWILVLPPDATHAGIRKWIIDSAEIKRRWDDSLTKYWWLKMHKDLEYFRFLDSAKKHTTYEQLEKDAAKEKQYNKISNAYYNKWKKYMDSLGWEPKPLK